MHKPSDLKLYGDYSRKDVHDIFDPKGMFTPQAGTWGLHGLVKIPGTVADFVFFVTYGQSQADHKFEESISNNGVINWQSQPRQGLNDQKVLRWINQKQNQDKIYLFVRPKKGELYSLLGNIEYLSHDMNLENPVHFQFQILSWKPNDYILQSFCTKKKYENNVISVKENLITKALSEAEKDIFNSLKKEHKEILVEFNNIPLLKALFCFDQFHNDLPVVTDISEIRVPKMEDDHLEIKVSSLLKEIGENIEIDEPLIELETSKSILEVPSDISGVVHQYEVRVGDVVNVGHKLAIITTEEITEEYDTHFLTYILDKLEKNQKTTLLLFDDKIKYNSEFTIKWSWKNGSLVKKGKRIFAAEKSGPWGKVSHSKFAEEDFIIDEILIDNGTHEINGFTPVAIVSSPEDINSSDFKPKEIINDTNIKVSRSKKIDSTPLSKDHYLSDFILQSLTDNLKTAHYQKEFLGLKMKVSFGQGALANIPWISFTGVDMKVSNGFYPVYLFYKNENILILSYGVSETFKHNGEGWPKEITSRKTKISTFLSNPSRYGSSYVFKFYNVAVENSNVYLSRYKEDIIEKEVEVDLNEIVDYYKDIITENNDPLEKLVLETHFNYEKSTWNTKNVEELKLLWDTDKSLNEIADDLNLTKNAVSGKALRLGLPQKSSPNSDKNTSRQQKENLNKDVLYGDIYNLLENYASLYHRITNDIDLNEKSYYKNFLDELLIKYNAEIINDKNVQFDENFHELVNQVLIEENDDQSKHNQICKTLQIGLKINGEIYKKQKVDVAIHKSNIGLLSFKDEESIIDYIISNPEAFNMNEGYRFEKYYDFDGDDVADLICFGPGKEIKIFGVTNKLDHQAIKKAKKVKQWNLLLSYEKEEDEDNSFFINHLVTLDNVPMTKKFCKDYNLNYNLLK